MMPGHDIRRNDRHSAWTARIILAAKDGDLDGAWAVLNETNNDPTALRSIAILAASMAAERMSEGHTELLTAAMVDKLAAPPHGRWYPGDPPPEASDPVS